MRNLTKVLALVLSLAFVMTMFAGAVTPVAKYSDAATTTAGDEAVTVLRALGIVDGYPDGHLRCASVRSRVLPAA